MATENTSDNNLRLILPTVATEDGTWGALLNTLISEFERSITAIHTQDFTASDVTLLADGTADEAARKAILVATGTLAGNVNFVVPNEPKIYIVVNNTTEDFTLGIKTSAGSALEIPQGETYLVWCNGSAVIATINANITGTVAEATNALQLGSVVAANYAQKAVLNQWTKPQIVDATQVTLTAGTYTPDANADTTVVVPQSELTVALTIANPTNSPLDGQVMLFVIEQHDVDVRSVTWGSDFIFPDDTAVDLTQTVDKVDCFSFMYSTNLSRWMNFGTALNLPRA